MDLTAFKNFKTKIEEQNNGGSDPDIFMPEFDKSGKSEFIIRFLPQFNDKGKLDPNEIFFFEWRKHSFKGVSVGGEGFFNKLCPRTAGKECYICDNSSNIYNTSSKLYSLVKARISYITAVQIVKYDANPELEGQIKLFYVSKNFLLENLLPELTDEVEPNPIHDLKEGCNVGVTITKSDKGRKFTTKFYKPSDISKKVKKDDIIDVKKWIQDKINSILEKDPKAFNKEAFKQSYLNMFPTAEKKNKININNTTPNPTVDPKAETQNNNTTPNPTDSEIDIDKIADEIVE